MQVPDEKTENKLDATDKTYKFTDVVKFDFKYPKDFGLDADGKPTGKKKHMKEGIVEIHKLQAEDFEKRGFGKIVK